MAANTVLSSLVIAGHSRSKNGVASLAYAPAIHLKNNRLMSYWVYFLANKPGGTLYVGVTNNLVRRVCEHREGLVDGFTKQYGVKTLVYFENHDTAVGAIQREKNIKGWNRERKIDLITSSNPTWHDLYDEIST